MDSGIYFSWVALIVATLANVISNTALKKAMSSIDAGIERNVALQLASQTSLWIGLFSALVLLLSYLFAIRTISVATAYASTTSLAMVGILILESRILGTTIGFTKIFGMMFVACGIVLLTWTA